MTGETASAVEYETMSIARQLHYDEGLPAVLATPDQGSVSPPAFTKIHGAARRGAEFGVRRKRGGSPDSSAGCRILRTCVDQQDDDARGARFRGLGNTTRA